MFKVAGKPKGSLWVLEIPEIYSECAEVMSPQSDDGSPGVGRELSLGRPRREATQEGFPGGGDIEPSSKDIWGFA